MIGWWLSNREYDRLRYRWRKMGIFSCWRTAAVPNDFCGDLKHSAKIFSTLLAKLIAQFNLAFLFVSGNFEFAIAARDVPHYPAEYFINGNWLLHSVIFSIWSEIRSQFVWVSVVIDKLYFLTLVTFGY